MITLQIVLFQFGLGVNAHYIILELYAQGNIILTDSEFTVLTLLRSHRLVQGMSLCLYVLNKLCAQRNCLGCGVYKCLFM